MPIVSHDVLRKFVYDIYRGAGGTEEDARIVSDHVVDSNLAGHDSHGVINAPNYIGGMAGGPAADKMEIVRESGAATVINVNGALGMVAARKAMEMAVEKAESCTIGAVGLHRCGHAGRMGEYPPIAARAGMIGIVLLNGGGRFMHPHGGSSRRLPPNPIAISVPRQGGEPLLLDITLSVVAGGKLLVQDGSRRTHTGRVDDRCRRQTAHGSERVSRTSAGHSRYAARWFPIRAQGVWTRRDDRCHRWWTLLGRM